MYSMDSSIKKLLSAHRTEAEQMISASGSNLVYEAFSPTWLRLDGGSVSATAGSDVLSFDPDQIIRAIDRWIQEIQQCREDAIAELNAIEEPTVEERIKVSNIGTDVDFHILPAYNQLKGRIKNVDTQFLNTGRAYRSPIQQGLNDINILYREIRSIEGDFAGFKDVSVYIHGIEDNGSRFFETAVEAANGGDIIVYQKRNGEQEYYRVSTEEGQNWYSPVKVDDINNTSGRLHLVYETEHKNEHRQQTSDSLTETLIDMGLMNDETMIDMYAHSYGGRRSLQFAMDYPEHVRSITTIGTPYDTNFLGGLANRFSGIAGIANYEATEFSDYLSFNEDDRRVDNNMEHSNVYTDMHNVSMEESVSELRAANPEIYDRLIEIEITAAAGRDYSDYSLRGIEYRSYSTNDGAVSVTSQHAESLEALINDRPLYDIKGQGITNPAHSFQIRNPEFVALVKSVNAKY